MKQYKTLINTLGKNTPMDHPCVRFLDIFHVTSLNHYGIPVKSNPMSDVFPNTRIEVVDDNSKSGLMQITRLCHQTMSKNIVISNRMLYESSHYLLKNINVIKVFHLGSLDPCIRRFDVIVKVIKDTYENSKPYVLSSCDYFITFNTDINYLTDENQMKILNKITRLIYLVLIPSPLGRNKMVNPT